MNSSFISLSPLAFSWNMVPYFLAAMLDLFHRLRRFYKRFSLAEPQIHTEPKLNNKTAINYLTETTKEPNLSQPRPLGVQLEGDLLRQFLKSMNYDMKDEPIKRNMKLEAAMAQLFESQNLEPEYLEPALRLLPLTCAATEMPYYNHPFDVKVYITTFTTLLLYLDDACERFPEVMLPELTQFVWTFGKSADVKNPNLRHFLRLVTEETPKYFGPFSTGAIMKSTMDFFCGCMIESNFPRGLTIPRSSSRFPRFLRLKTGCSEAYAHMIFPSSMFPETDLLERFLPTIPDIIELIDMINDIMSFYKESVVGSEENTFFMNCARLHKCDPVKIFRIVCSNQVGLMRDVDATLSSYEECKTTFAQFMKGYLMWHSSQKRYRLTELGIVLGQAKTS